MGSNPTPTIMTTLKHSNEASSVTTTTVAFADTAPTTPRIRLRKIKTYEQNAECPCGGDFKHTGSGISQGTTRWQHRCTDCNTEAWFNEAYPNVVYR